MTYGFVTSVKRVTGASPMVVENGVAVAQNPEKTVVVSQSQVLHNYVDLKVTGFNSAHNGEEIIMCLFVCNGTEIYYISDGMQGNVATAYTVNILQ